MLPYREKITKKRGQGVQPGAASDAAQSPSDALPDDAGAACAGGGDLKCKKKPKLLEEKIDDFIKYAFLPVVLCFFGLVCRQVRLFPLRVFFYLYVCVC